MADGILTPYNVARAVWHGFKKPRFFRFKKNLKNLKSPNLGFLGFYKNKNLMSDLSFFYLLCN